ncbi:MAG: thioredoxin family protein [Candidatus Methanomethylicaceae archaeon]
MKALDCATFKKLLEERCSEMVAVFTASWCGYCRMLLCELEQTKPDMPLTLVDISDEGCWDEFGIEIVPTAILYKDGKEIRRVCSPDGLRLRDLQELFLSSTDH